MPDDEQADWREETRRRLDLQEERLRRESVLTGWDECRHLDDEGRRCAAAPRFGGYCREHLPEYPFPRLVDHPRDRWRDASVLAASPENMLALLWWLVTNGALGDARRLVAERADEIVDSLRETPGLSEVRWILERWHATIPRQALEHRVYFILQPRHDVAYRAMVRQFQEQGIDELR